MSSSTFRFVVVGSCSTAIDFFIYMLLSMKYPISNSKAASMILASVFSYIANKSFTFKNKSKENIRYLIRFYTVFAVAFAANLGVNYLVFQYTGYKIAAFILATLCGMSVNYLGQRFFVFY